MKKILLTLLILSVSTGEGTLLFGQESIVTNPQSKQTVVKNSPILKKQEIKSTEDMKQSNQLVQKQSGNDKTVGLKALVVLKSIDSFNENANLFCSKKTTAKGSPNPKMYKRCIKNQTQGYSDYKRLNARYADKVFYKDMMFPYCSAKWTRQEGLVDVKMVAFCLQNEVEGFSLFVNYQIKYDKRKVIEIAEEALIQHGSWRLVGYAIYRHFKTINADEGSPVSSGKSSQ